MASYQPLVNPILSQVGYRIYRSLVPGRGPTFGICARLCCHQQNQPGKMATWAQLRLWDRITLFSCESVVSIVSVRVSLSSGGFSDNPVRAQTNPSYALLQGAASWDCSSHVVSAKRILNQPWPPVGLLWASPALETQRHVRFH